MSDWTELYAEYLEGEMQAQELQSELENHSNDLAHELLHVPMGPNDADAATVGEYLGLLLSTLWIEDEGFSGKRPFGNSGWKYDVYAAMGKAGLADITFDEYGYVESFTDVAEAKADELILQAIRLAYNHD